MVKKEKNKSKLPDYLNIWKKIRSIKVSNMLLSTQVLFALFIASPNFIFPKTGSWIYIIFLFLFEGFYFQARLSHRRMIDRVSKSEEWEYSTEEANLIKEYSTFFLFPLTSRGVSTKMATIQLLTYVIVPWLLFKGIWFQAIIIGVNYFVATNLAVLFNPQFYMNNFINNINVKKKKGVSHFSQHDLSLYVKYCRELNIVNIILARHFSISKS